MKDDVSLLSPRARRLNHSLENSVGNGHAAHESDQGRRNLTSPGRTATAARSRSLGVRMATTGGMMPSLPSHRMSPRGPGAASKLSMASPRLSSWTLTSLEDVQHGGYSPRVRTATAGGGESEGR